MKRIVITVLFLLCGATAVVAQMPRGYVAILPGAQFGSGIADSGAVGSIDAGLFVTEKVALHFGIWHNKGNYSIPQVASWRYPPGGYTYAVPLAQPFTVFEFGPELAPKISVNGQLYFQVNLGYSAGLESSQDWPISGGFHDDWTFGFTVGYRHFFKGGVGVAGQLAYHHISSLGTDQWDARVGVVFKFH